MANRLKWGAEPTTATVGFFHKRIRELVERRLADSGRSWEEAVWDPSLELSSSDFAEIEAEMLATGYRFEFSARISVEEAPEKYRSEQDDVDDSQLERDEQGRALVGSGDNVFRVKSDVVGTARIISTIDTVMQMLVDGVPEGTVAIIDDSGGTLTAPILEGFTAVVCKGGSIRSHLGILTREYNIPCLMATEIHGIRDGDQVQVEYSAEAVSPYTQDNVRARVWKLN